MLSINSVLTYSALDGMHPRMKRYLLISIAFIVVAIPLVLFSQSRLIAPDEGFYLLAAKLVMDGRIPYVDFFYPQGPLHPYIYGAWGFLTQASWSSARFFSALLGALSVTVLCPYIRREVSLWAASAFVLMCATSELILPWFTLTKPYAATALALSLAFLSFCDPSSIKNASRFLVGIFFLSLATQLRAYSIALLPLFTLLWIRRREALQVDTRTAWAVVLVVISCLPSLILAMLGPDAFYFNNLGYHLVRVADPRDASMSAKLDIVLKALGIRAATRVGTLQPAILMAGFLLHLLIALFRRRVPSAAWCTAAVLFVVSLLPSPTHLQYFCLAAPFMIIAALEAVHELYAFVPRALSLVLSALCIAAYVHGLPQALAVYVTGGPGVNGSNDTDAWSLTNADEIAGSINSLTAPGHFVMSEWPGYLYGTHAAPLPGMENHFGFVAAARLDESSRRRYHVITRPDSMAYIRDPNVRLVLVPHNKRRASYEALMSQSCFTEKAVIDSISLYQSCTARPNSSGSP